MLSDSANMFAWFSVVRASSVALQISINIIILYTFWTQNMIISKTSTHEKKIMILLDWIIWKSIYVHIMKRRHRTCQNDNKYHYWNFIIKIVLKEWFQELDIIKFLKLFVFKYQSQNWSHTLNKIQNVLNFQKSCSRNLHTSS